MHFYALLKKKMTQEKFISDICYEYSTLVILYAFVFFALSKFPMYFQYIKNLQLIYLPITFRYERVIKLKYPKNIFICLLLLPDVFHILLYIVCIFCTFEFLNLPQKCIEICSLLVYLLRFDINET